MNLRILTSILMMTAFAAGTSFAANEPVTPPNKVPGTKVPGLPTDARNDGPPHAMREGTAKSTTTRVIPGKTISTTQTKTTTTEEGVAADNSGVNQRDYNANNDKVGLTSEDQARGTDADVETTRKIREAIMSEKNLSTYAHNVKIITLNKLVTLRGPVRTNGEVAKIKDIARRFAGATNVRSELQVEPENR